MPPCHSFAPLGDHAVVVHLGETIDDATFQRVRALSRQLNAESFAGLIEFVPAYTTVTAYYDPLQLSFDEACTAVDRLLADQPEQPTEETRVIEIPVCYGGELGEDLEYVAQHTGVTVDEVIRLHSGADYRVHMLGFVPGFPYLGGMPPELATPRRNSPRLATPAGSVGIGGSQTGIYPLETPGGWQIIGRTPLRLFRPQQDPPTLLQAGDMVRFRPIPRGEYDSVRSQTEDLPHLPVVPRSPAITILRPGMLATVQDLGRHGFQQYGVVTGGAMDALSLRIANMLVGNEEGAAALELTLLGPTLRFERDSLIGICGADLSPRVSEATIPMNRPVWVKAGTTVAFGAAKEGCRAYLAIAGGIDVPQVLGSRGTYLRSGIGGYAGRALLADDQLIVGTPSEPSLSLFKQLAEPKGEGPFATVPWQTGVQVNRTAVPEIRVLRGAEFEKLTSESRHALFSSEFEVTAQSDRMGYRLAGPKLDSASDELISAAVCPGTIQLPPDGQPILLMADCATTGGYPKILHVASVDLPPAAQLRPGDSCRLREISLAEAHNLYRQQEADLRCLKTGLKLKFTHRQT